MGQQFFLAYPPVQLKLSGISATGLGQRSELTYSISSKHEKAQVHVRIILDNGLQPETSELEWRGQVDVDKPVIKEFSVAALQNGTWKIEALATAVINDRPIKLRDAIYLEVGEAGSRFLSLTEYALLEIKKIQESQPVHPDAEASPLLEPVMKGFTPQMILKQGQAESRGLRKSQQGESVLGCNGTITVSGYV